jgi:hypothetical protein
LNFLSEALTTVFSAVSTRLILIASNLSCLAFVARGCFCLLGNAGDTSYFAVLAWPCG